MSAIGNFQSAAVVPKLVDAPEEWNATVTFGAPAATARVIGREHQYTIRVIFADAPEGTQVFDPQDYTNTIEIRVKDSTLYVYRSITLFWVEYHLAVFDLATRRRVADFLVSPEDMQPTQR